MKRLLSLTAVAVALAASSAQAQQVSVKIGVMSDMSSLYADIGGSGSTAPAKLAVSGFTKANPNVQGDLVFREHQKKTHVGAPLANQWFEVSKGHHITSTSN